ncbi:MAG: 1-deoxy-D-xylulose-5-phosphate reductoisomerase [Syntrophaceae bacterium]|nr:1-deoxy-D-xylulose-5-phosphate reductoisomerase [Syntrophaceae bacterium]
MKTLSLLGSTGSIGVNTLDVLASHPGEWRVAALAAGRNITMLCGQIERFRPRLVAVIDEEHATAMRQRLKGPHRPAVRYGSDGYCEAAALADADMVVSALVGASGLLPTLAAIDAGHSVALANKETLVMAGEIVMARASQRGVHIIPVDSEHSAIYQCLQAGRRDEVRRIVLTASGGPFLQASPETLETVTITEALRHPNWSMGKKVTVDSATMMNKGLEVIEAQWLFGLPLAAIEVVIHPQSIVHSLVEYVDGSVIAQLGLPDMRVPIAYALSHPRRLVKQEPFLDLCRMGPLTFLPPDLSRFPALGLAFEAVTLGGTLPAVMNRANEEAVTAFIEGRIGFMDIPRLTAQVMANHHPVSSPTLPEILAADGWAKNEAFGMLDTSPERYPGSRPLNGRKVH